MGSEEVKVAAEQIADQWQKRQHLAISAKAAYAVASAYLATLPKWSQAPPDSPGLWFWCEAIGLPVRDARISQDREVVGKSLYADMNGKFSAVKDLGGYWSKAVVPEGPANA